MVNNNDYPKDGNWNLRKSLNAQNANAGTSNTSQMGGQPAPSQLEQPQYSPPLNEPKSQLKHDTVRVSQDSDVRRLNSIVDEPDEDLGASLWKRGKRTLDIEFKFTRDDASAQPLVCHSLIVSHWSTVLAIMAEKAKGSGRRNENGQAIIEIDNRDFRRSDFEILIRYLYFRDVNIDKMTPLRRRRLITLSRVYHVPGLERACKRFLQYPLCAGNVYLYLDEALEKQDETLKRKCLEIIRMNRGCFSPDIEYFDISADIMHEIVSLQQLPITEMELFTFFYKWYEATKDGDTSADDGQHSFTFLNNNNNTQEIRQNENNCNNNQSPMRVRGSESQGAKDAAIRRTECEVRGGEVRKCDGVKKPEVATATAAVTGESVNGGIDESRNKNNNGDHNDRRAREKGDNDGEDDNKMKNSDESASSSNSSSKESRVCSNDGRA